jgi:hypothetical protein
MNYQEFLEKILDLCLAGGITDYSNFYLHVDDEQNRTLNKRWISGGMQNGSCWNTKLQPRPPEPEPEFTALTKLLPHFAPALTFLQYQSIVELLYYTWIEEREYYGNCVEYDVRYIRLEDLYNLLTEWNYV